jgi:hypothetical protein
MLQHVQHAQRWDAEFTHAPMMHRGRAQGILRIKARVPPFFGATTEAVCFSISGMRLPALRPPLLAGLTLNLLISACTVPPLRNSDELRVDSLTLGPEHNGGVGGSPFCLHLRFVGNFYVVLSERQVEGWTTDGRCDSEGAPRAVEQLRLNWRFQGYETQRSRQCMNATGCRSQERDIVEGHALRCASAMAQQGNQTAFITSDAVGCP